MTRKLKLITIYLGVSIMISSHANSQDQISIYSNGNISDVLDEQMDWFKQISKNYEESAYCVTYSLGNDHYNFSATAKRFIDLNREPINEHNFQFGQGSIMMDDGRQLNVKYMYNNEVFRVELKRYLENGRPDPSFFKNGVISRTINKRDSEGSLIVFTTDENLVIAGYTQSDSTFVYIR